MKIIVYSFWVKKKEEKEYCSKKVVSSSADNAAKELSLLGYEICKKPYFENSDNKKNYFKAHYSLKKSFF